jgi:hypothetical protein
MEKELNISAILKDKPVGTKLWSPIFGDCKCSRLLDSGMRVFPIHNGFTSTEEKSFFKTGKYTLAGEVCLFPSKQMQDWSKFAWKEGDVLTDEERFVVFKGFNTDDYTEFSASFEYKDGTCRRNLWLVSNDFRKVSDNIAQEIIKKVEEHYGCKLNLETIEIEKQPEFKDGDILYSNLVGNEVFIAKIEEKGILHSYVYMDIYNKVLNIDKDETFAMSGCIYNGNIHLATDSEKQQLFSALAKEGKRWNPVTKQIYDLPKKCEFKPMDWCLMKDSTKYWELCQFAYTRKVHGTTIYSAVGGLIYYKCIPYNEETKHLLGTTDEWKGGEG